MPVVLVLPLLCLRIGRKGSLTVMPNPHLMTHHQTQSHCRLCPMERMVWLCHCHFG